MNNNTILIGIVIIFFSFYLYLKRKNKKRIEQITEELKFKAVADEKEYLEGIERKKQKAQEEYNKFCKDIAEKRKLNESLLEEDKKHSYEKVMLYEKLELEKSKQRIAAEVLEIKNKSYDELNAVLEGLNEVQKVNQENYEKEQAARKEQIQELLDKIKETENELLELEVKRNATIESWKREEEIRIQKDFYRIVLTDKDKNDIELLNSIRNKLNNQDSLNRLIYDVFIKKPMTDMLLRVIGNNGYSGIYKITHIPSQKCYIGKSVDVKKRLIEHCKGAYGIATIADQHIHRAMNELGIDNFTFEILEKVPKDKLTDKEKYWIKYYNSVEYGWNEKIG